MSAETIDLAQFVSDYLQLEADGGERVTNREIAEAYTERVGGDVTEGLLANIAYYTERDS